MHSFSYVRGFSLEGFFNPVTSFNEASEDSVSLILFCVTLHLPYEGKCQNKEASGDEEVSRDEEASGDEEASRDEEASGHD